MRVGNNYSPRQAYDNQWNSRAGRSRSKNGNQPAAADTAEEEKKAEEAESGTKTGSAAKSAETAKPDATPGDAAAGAESEGASGEAAEAGRTETADAAAQALADLKKDFKAFLDGLLITPGLARAPINIAVSDAAFEKMLADPEYREEIESKFRKDFMNLDWLTASPTYLHIGVDANGKYTSTPYVDSYGGNFASETKNSFWTRRTEGIDPDGERIVDEDQALLDLIRSQTPEERKLFHKQLVSQYRTSMLSLLNQNRENAAGGLAGYL